MLKKFFLFLTAAIFLSGCCFRGTPEYHKFTAHFSDERTELFCDGEKWDFARFLQAELTAHPEMECADLVKFCCQAAFGIDRDAENGRKRFFAEFESVKPDSSLELILVTSPDTARVNLAAWKAAGLPPEWLFRMSVVESEFSDSKQKMQEYVNIAAAMIPAGKMKFTADEFRQVAKQCLSGHRHLRHSQSYRKNTPAYRIISTRYFHTIPALRKAAAMTRKNDGTPLVIAIDGRSASGKTTLANQLKIILNAQVIHMDDFFLPLAMRTEMRYNEAGGNVHYERFKEEVLPNLKKPNAFSYRIFDCKKKCFNGNRMVWENSSWRIVEGAYSHHRQFGNYADLKIFYDIDPAEQMRRINNRNGAHAAKAFQSKWIPLEEKYIRTFSVDKNADLIIK